MNAVLIIANILVFLTFIVHAFIGDGEVKRIEPPSEDVKKLEFWTMARGSFHMVSVDFLFASIGLALINFTNYFEDAEVLLNIMTIYFVAYGMVYLLIITISKNFPNNYLKVGQWLLMFVIASLIYFGNK